MTADEFTKLFKYMEEFRREVNERFEKVDGEIRDTKLAIGELLVNLPVKSKSIIRRC